MANSSSVCPLTSLVRPRETVDGLRPVALPASGVVLSTGASFRKLQLAQMGAHLGTSAKCNLRPDQQVWQAGQRVEISVTYRNNFAAKRS
jgi:hypothetical protein